MTGSSSRQASLLDAAVIGAGALAFVSSLLPWYRGSFSVFGFSGSVGVNAWNAGAGAWMPVVLLVAAGMVILVAGVGRPTPAWSARLVLGLSVLALVCLGARWAGWSDTGDGVGTFGEVELSGSALGGLVDASAGVGVGFYLALLAAVTAVIASALGVRTAYTQS